MELDRTVGVPSVCVIIPLCNEEASLPMLGERLRMLGHRLGRLYRMRFLFVDDGSTDRTRELLPSVVPAETSYKVLSHAVNQGIGAAFRTAFRAATEDIVCTIDADCSYGPEHLAEMIEDIAKGRADICVASPYHPLGGAEGVKRWRLLLSANCSLLYRLVSPLELYTYTSIFRAYRGSVVRQVRFSSDDFIAAVEILLSAASLGYRVCEIPLVLHRRSAGVSKMRVARTIAGHLRLLARCLLARDGFPRSLASGRETLQPMKSNLSRLSPQPSLPGLFGVADVSSVLDAAAEGKGVLPR